MNQNLNSFSKNLQNVMETENLNDFFKFFDILEVILTFFFFFINKNTSQKTKIQPKIFFNRK